MGKSSVLTLQSLSRMNVKWSISEFEAVHRRAFARLLLSIAKGIALSAPVSLQQNTRKATAAIAPPRQAQDQPDRPAPANRRRMS